MTNLRYSVADSGVGATIHGVNLAAGLSAQHTLQIRELLNQHRVVVVRDQALDDEHLTSFAFRFGPPFVADDDSPVLGSDGKSSNPVTIIGNQAHEYPRSYLGNQEVLPHSDHQWLRCPSAISLLYAVAISADSSPTVWIDMARAYSLLDAETREVIQELRLTTYNPFYRPFGSVSAKYIDRRVDVPPGATVAHPLVCTHPETREKVLYLHAAYEMELVGIPYEIGSALIARLHQHIKNVAHRYEHHWENGDLVLWDNRATIHYRSAFPSTVRRVLKRVTVGGGIPY